MTLAIYEDDTSSNTTQDTVFNLSVPLKTEYFPRLTENEIEFLVELIGDIIPTWPDNVVECALEAIPCGMRDNISTDIFITDIEYTVVKEAIKEVLHLIQTFKDNMRYYPKWTELIHLTVKSEMVSGDLVRYLIATITLTF